MTGTSALKESQILLLKQQERKGKETLDEVISQAPFQAGFHGFRSKDKRVPVK